MPPYYSNHAVLSLLCYLATLNVFIVAFSLHSGNALFPKNARTVNYSNDLHSLDFDRSRSQFQLFAAPKRKDNRKYALKPKDEEDEVDEDYFKDLAEDVQILLRKPKTVPVAVDSSTTSETSTVIKNVPQEQQTKE